MYPPACPEARVGVFLFVFDCCFFFFFLFLARTRPLGPLSGRERDHHTTIWDEELKNWPG
eukprot:7204907-Pyramimonas_sp.AAC.1